MITDYSSQQAIDLAVNRKTKTFNEDELSCLIYDSKQNLEHILKLTNIVEKDRAFNKEKLIYMDRKEAIQWNFNVAKRILELKAIYSLSDEDVNIIISIIDVPNPLYLHSIFVNAVNTQMDSIQNKPWLDKINQFKVLGCYAQTELGHGSALSNLETTATYDPTSDSFIIHSPTISSAKFWPGGLANFSNHCLLYAQLYIKGKCYGPHGFIVPLRSIENNSILPGIKLYDIGPKMGFATVDNGCAMFNQVKIPRENMLMKFSKVDENGIYTSPPHSKLVYAVMTGTRVMVIEGAWIPLARTCVIALRYSLVRRQGSQPNSIKQEPQIINYITVQYKLFTLLASVFALNLVSKWMKEVYKKMINKIQVDGDVSLLGSSHAISTALKVYTTQISADGVEIARRTLGGHGYLASSNMPNLVNTTVASMTYEGDNSLLTQQTARYLVKQYKKIINRDEDIDYIVKEFKDIKAEKSKVSVISSSLELNPTSLIQLFSSRLYSQLNEFYQLNMQTKFELLNLESIKLSDAFAQYLTVTQFYQQIQQYESQSIFPVLTVLFEIYSIHTLLSNLSEFFQYELLSPSQIPLLQAKLKSLFKVLVPNVATILDAFQFSDFTLNSSLGLKQGNVYEKMFKDLEANPLNSDQQFKNELSRVINQITHLDILGLKNKL
ncbi:acyl-CoA oxidase [Neoconidiobolus thromboides FSU 785]|nr:acyl-CoA oxidase [Neoconidiobolus thromboides FSU 785]